MPKSICFLMIVPACLFAGCGGSPKELPVAKSAHGGNLVSLPNDRGFVEILIESTTGGSGGRKAEVKTADRRLLLPAGWYNGAESGPD